LSALEETTIDSQRVYEGGFLKINRDRVRLPDGCQSFRVYVLHPGAAVMVPLTMSKTTERQILVVAAVQTVHSMEAMAAATVVLALS
jgi:hypothetical protein